MPIPHTGAKPPDPTPAEFLLFVIAFAILIFGRAAFAKVITK